MGQENLLRMVRWGRWHCPLDTWFEIQTLEVRGRARYLSVTKAPHKNNKTGKRTSNSSVKGSGANHYPRAPAHRRTKWATPEPPILLNVTLQATRDFDQMLFNCWPIVFNADPTIRQLSVLRLSKCEWKPRQYIEKDMIHDISSMSAHCLWCCANTNPTYVSCEVGTGTAHLVRCLPPCPCCHICLDGKVIDRGLTSCFTRALN